jgi:hypothetical protein
MWQGPGQGVGENHSASGQTVPELLNRFGADGWELAGLQDYRDGGDETSYWGSPVADGVHLQAASPWVAQSQVPASTVQLPNARSCRRVRQASLGTGLVNARP